MNIRFLRAAAFAASTVVAASLPVVSSAAVSVGVSIGIAPPLLPVYAQPAIPAPGYLWTPGYWRWDPAGGDYYWVPGTWVAPPYVGALWTPGYWGWGGGGYVWHGGYWGRTVGFYGGVNYGFGYGGRGYDGGRWDGGQFSYNRSVNNINPTFVHNTYNSTVVQNNVHVSYNGGNGGVNARPSSQEQAARAEQHAPPTGLQRQHEQAAARDPQQRFAANQGAPSRPALARPAAFQGGPHGGPGGGGERAMAMHEGPHGGHEQMPHGGGGHGGQPGGHEGHPGGGGQHGHEH